MAVALIRRMAARGPVPVYPAIGAGALPAAERLLAEPGLSRAASPRHAGVLLVCGSVPETAAKALDRVHDQLPHPRVCIDWDGVEPVTERIDQAWRDLCAGASSAPDRCPDVPPNEWRGKGENGQGGDGMMGGVPYGRPMAMTGEDLRDGLQLDRYTARIGPFAPMLPPGLVLEVTLQGDVIVALTVCAAPFPQPPEADAPVACAARLLHLLGLETAARRIRAGRRPLAAFPGQALPPGLGAFDGAGDARTRLADWMAGRSRPVEAKGLAASLIGLEWHEATLALASLPPSAQHAALTEGLTA